MYFQANLVILDEPTTALSLMETRKVLNFVLKIKERGKSCILITHNIYHAYEVSDRFVVLDRGRVAETVNKKEISCENLMERMAHIAGSEVCT
jgi:simple sugar transport system ATP-binding protein